MSPYILDFETTDIDPKKCEPVEMALLAFDGEILVDTLIRPVKEIPPEVSAVHHITDADVFSYPAWGLIKAGFRDEMEKHPGTPILVAHNAKYEKDVLGEFCEVHWICTYKAALRIWKDAPNYKNETLRYWLKLGDNRGRSGNQATHSALHDTLVTRLILLELLKHCTLDDMIAWTKEPAKLNKIPFGKHKGKTWAEIDGGYLNWILQQGDMEEDIKFCAKNELQRRKG